MMNKKGEKKNKRKSKQLKPIDCNNYVLTEATDVDNN